MIAGLFDLAAVALMATGLFFMAVAAMGFLRFPDVYCRLHVTGVLDTLGAPAMLLGVAIHIAAGYETEPFTESFLLAGKLFLAVAFLLVTSPLVGHLLSIAALESGHKPESAGSLPASDSVRERIPARSR